MNNEELNPNEGYEEFDDDIVTEKKDEVENNNEDDNIKKSDKKNKKPNFNEFLSNIKDKLKNRQKETDTTNIFKNKNIKIGIGIVASLFVLGGAYYAYVSSSVEEPDYNMETINQNIQVTPSKKQEHKHKVIQHKTEKVKVQKTTIKPKPSKKVKITKKPTQSLPEIKNIKKEVMDAKNDPIVKNIKENITKIPNDVEKKDLMTLNSEKLIENKNYEQYLQSKIEVMQKLLLYYKKTAELKKALDVYKQVLNPNKSTKGNGAQNTQKQSMPPELKSTLIQLQNQIATLKDEIKKQKKPQISIQTPQKKLDITSMNVFIKDGRYIAVVKSKSGDRILQVGDIYNGAKIVGITPTTITFQKGTQRYYYNTSPSFNTNYQTAKIKLPTTISTTSLKENPKDKKNVKEYKQETPQDRLQKLLEQRMKR